MGYGTDAYRGWHKLQIEPCCTTAPSAARVERKSVATAGPGGRGGPCTRTLFYDITQLEQVTWSPFKSNCRSFCHPALSVARLAVLPWMVWDAKAAPMAVVTEPPIK